MENKSSVPCSAFMTITSFRGANHSDGTIARSRRNGDRLRQWENHLAQLEAGRNNPRFYARLGPCHRDFVQVDLDCSRTKVLEVISSLVPPEGWKSRIVVSSRENSGSAQFFPETTGPLTWRQRVRRVTWLSGILKSRNCIRNCSTPITVRSQGFNTSTVSRSSFHRVRTTLYGCGYSTWLTAEVECSKFGRLVGARYWSVISNIAPSVLDPINLDMVISAGSRSSSSKGSIL